MLHSNTLRASFWPFWRSFIDMVIRDINSFAPWISGRPKVENQSNGKPSSNLSCEALSVFDGVTVKVQYIGDEDHLLPTANNGTANGVIKSSQQLLLGLEERKKAAAEVTTVPLRQALSANYKNTAVTTVKNHSFIGSITKY